MIQNWVEVEVELFREIFDSFLNHSGDTTGKVIEIQSPASIWYKGRDDMQARIFLGSGINPLEYRKWNEAICSVYEHLTDLFGEETSLKDDYGRLNLCMFGHAPFITTVGSCEDTVKMFWETSFASEDEFSERNKKLIKLDQLVMWYYKKGDKIYYDMRRLPRKDVDHLVRIRVMDLDDWKKIVSDAIVNGGEFSKDFTKDDIKKSDMVVYEMEQ